MLALWQYLLICERGEDSLDFIHLLVFLVVVDYAQALEPHLGNLRHLLGQATCHAAGHAR